MKKIIGGKTYTFMEVDQCKEMRCRWFNDYDNKCMLSGMKVTVELYCSRYAQWKQRQKELRESQ